MKYQSTRGDKVKVSAAQAIAAGQSKDGGLYVPESFPKLSQDDIANLQMLPYSRRASKILSLFLADFSLNELDNCAQRAYSHSAFDHPDITPMHKIDNNTYFLELWHGPTAAFKDMALQIMPELLTASLNKLGEKREVCILVATSGDTGKAAMEGFCDVQGTRIMVFYPSQGVSNVQKLQMTSQRGSNVAVMAVRGNFDDTQNGVKAIFADNSLSEALDKEGIFLSSANSINWGRLVPQIAYYVSSYCDLLTSGAIGPGQRVNYCVPTGNFGNILAAYYALKIGLPIGKLVCASNRNDVLTQFINTGVYDINRAFFTTISPSMDILISSNLERLLFELSDKDGGIISSYMSCLSGCGQYGIPSSVLEQIRQVFASGYCSEEDTMQTIKDTLADSGYLIDTHTAVAYKALNDYRNSSGDNTPAVVISTASPFKFPESVLKALKYDGVINGGIEQAEELSRFTGVEIPSSLRYLKEQKERFDTVIDKSEMKKAVIEFAKSP